MENFSNWFFFDDRVTTSSNGTPTIVVTNLGEFNFVGRVFYDSLRSDAEQKVEPEFAWNETQTPYNYITNHKEWIHNNNNQNTLSKPHLLIRLHSNVLGPLLSCVESLSQSSK